MTQKLETKCSLKWIDNLRKQFSLRGNRIKIFKTHGESFQMVGVSDYLGTIYLKDIPQFQGKTIAIEFKTYNEPVSPTQLDFLVAVLELRGIAMVVRFGDEYNPVSEYNSFLGACFHNSFHPRVFRYNINDYSKG